MKKLILLFCAVFVLTSLTNAQHFARSGVIELGGTIGFNSETEVYDGQTADNATTTFSLNPMVGYFIMNGLELGLLPIYQTTSHGDNTNSFFGIFFIPQYNFDVGSTVYPYVGGLIGYGSQTNGTDYSGISYGGVGGVKVTIGNSALINFSARYLLMTMEPDNWEGDRIGANQFEILAGFSVFVGN